MQKYKNIYIVGDIFKKRFRSLTAFAAEWCVPPYETMEKKMGGEENTAVA